MITTGSDFAMPPVEGLAEVDPWTSDDFFVHGSELPPSPIFLGGGTIGCETAQVTIVERIAAAPARGARNRR